MESHFIAESDNKRNFYGVWWGWEEKKAYREKPSTGIFEHREPKHSIPFGSDTIDGGKKEKEATRSPILASEKHNVSLFHLVGSSDFSETFFCLFENAVHFFSLLLPIGGAVEASDECIPKLQPKAETRRMFFFTNLFESTWAKSPSKEEIRKCLCRTQPSAAISLPSRSAIATRIIMEFTERTHASAVFFSSRDEDGD